MNTANYSWAGDWRAGKKHGNVKITDLKDNSVCDGKFDNGKFEKWVGTKHHREAETGIIRDGFEGTEVWSANGNYKLSLTT